MIKGEANEAFIEKLPIVPILLCVRSDHSDQDNVENRLEIDCEELEGWVVRAEYKHNSEY